jgi:hypothetical protein
MSFMGYRRVSVLQAAMDQPGVASSVAIDLLL